MSMTAKQIRSKAYSQLKSRGWGTPIGVCALEAIQISTVIKLFFVGIFFCGCFKMGSTKCYVDFVRKGEMVFEDMFSGFKSLARSMIAGTLTIVFTFLWSLLLIVPGIIVGLRYSMVFFVLNDNPTLTGRQAMDFSAKIMHGNKKRLFCLLLSFVGWWLLSVLTLGILLLWLKPYVRTAKAYFYEELVKDVTTNNPSEM